MLHEHLEPWVFSFLDRVQELGTEFQVRWAALAGEVLLAEAAWAGRPARLPVHLESAPPLPDPRREGGKAFLSGLLAPVRSGIVLTRTDLARLASALGMGTGITQRRRALEDLLSYDPTAVLTALGDAALESAERHEGRVATLGATGAFWADRARMAADLFGELAARAGPVEHLEEAR